MQALLKPIGLATLGFVIVLSGFAYDVLFAGIPYQDVAPEIQARWDFHKFVAGLFYKTGGVVLLVGILAVPIVWNVKRRQRRQSPEDNNQEAAE